MFKINFNNEKADFHRLAVTAKKNKLNHKEWPITIKIFSNYAQKIKISYKRYLLNNFNNKFKILNQKTNIIYTASKNPYI